MGHLFIINGDITQLACDAWLLPTARNLHVTKSFRHALPSNFEELASRYRFGANHVIPFDDTDGKGPDIWLAAVGHHWTPDELANDAEPRRLLEDIVEEFASKASARLRERSTDRDIPLLAINALGTGRGGFRRHQGQVYRTLIKAAIGAAARHSVDIVLVTWGARPYSAAQRTRQRFLLEEEITTEQHWALAAQGLHERAATLIGCAQDHRLVLFLGAGVSRGAGLPDWQGLLHDMADLIQDRNLDPVALSQLDPRDQASLLERSARRKGMDLRREVQLRMASDRYSLAHGLLASMRVREAVTTNFDCCYEAAFPAGDGDSLSVLPREPVSADQPWLLKLHGGLAGDESDDLVLTRDDYLRATRARGALMGIVQALMVTRHMLFVGYSLIDEDFHELVHEVRTALGDAHGPDDSFGTVLTLFDDPLKAQLWHGDLDVIPIAGPPPPADAGQHTKEAAVAAAARELEIFLDLVAASSFGLERFLLDPDFSQLLDDQERLVANRLSALIGELGDDALRSTALGREVLDLVEHCGYRRHSGPNPPEPRVPTTLETLRARPT